MANAFCESLVDPPVVALIQEVNPQLATVTSLPASLPKSERVQISARGRRFEMSMDVATGYCLSIFLFFALPVGWQGQADGPRAGDADPPTRVSDLVAVASATGGEQEAQLAETLHKHYITSVLPVLTALEAALAQQPSECDEASAAGKAVTTALPAVPTPEVIEYDSAQRQWRFHFAKKLSAEAEAHERERLQQLAVLAQQSLVSNGARHAMAAAGGLDPNGNPFLLLQPDFLGVLLVYLRRTEACRQERMKVKDAEVAWPVFPVRWHELGYDEQVSVTQLVRALGVAPLWRSVYMHPTADPEESSLYRSSHPERVVAKGALEDAAAGGTLRARAEQFLSDTAPDGEAKDETHVAAHPSVADDLLTLQSQGCSRCGMSGHAAASCPY